MCARRFNFHASFLFAIHLRDKAVAFALTLNKPCQSPFDGKIVKAWHIENSKGEKSPNLATRAGGKHIDLVVGKACRSTAHFISRFYPAMYDETLNGMDSFK